jgi:hypothetical protein
MNCRNNCTHRVATTNCRGAPRQITNRMCQTVVECVWNLMAHGDARVGKWRGNWRREWVASTLTLPRKVVYPALLPLMRAPRLPVLDWTDSPAELNGLVRFGETRNLVFARVPTRFKRTLLTGRHLWRGGSWGARKRDRTDTKAQPVTTTSC